MTVSGSTPAESGLASALLDVGQQIGGSSGIALLGTIAATTTKNQLAGVLPTHAVVNNALAAGYAAGFQIAVVIALFGFAVALTVFRAPSGLPVAQLAEETTAYSYARSRDGASLAFAVSGQGPAVLCTLGAFQQPKHGVGESSPPGPTRAEISPTDPKMRRCYANLP